MHVRYSESSIIILPPLLESIPQVNSRILWCSPEATVFKIDMDYAKFGVKPSGPF